jgi:hypothetical protein
MCSPRALGVHSLPQSFHKPDSRAEAPCVLKVRKRVTKPSTSTHSALYAEPQTRTRIPPGKRSENPLSNGHGATISPLQAASERVPSAVTCFLLVLPVLGHKDRRLVFGVWARKSFWRVRPASSWAKESRAQHANLDLWIGPGERSRHTSVYRNERIASMPSPSPTSRNGLR